MPAIPKESDATPLIYSMVQWTLQKDPTLRPTVKDILSQVFRIDRNYYSLLIMMIPMQPAVQQRIHEHKFELPEDVMPNESRYTSRDEPSDIARSSSNRSTSISNNSNTKAKAAPPPVNNASSSGDVRGSRVRPPGGAASSAVAGAKIITSSKVYILSKIYDNNCL